MVIAIGGVIAAVYAFVYPAKAADTISDIQAYFERSQEDIISIKEAQIDMQESIIDAIPKWVNFEYSPYETGNPMSSLYTIVSLQNKSTNPIKLHIVSFGDGELSGEDEVFVMPGESFGHVSDGWFSEIEYCLSGVSDGLKEGAFYERRVYEEGNLKDATQSFAKIKGCEVM